MFEIMITLGLMLTFGFGSSPTERLVGLVMLGISSLALIKISQPTE